VTRRPLVLFGLAVGLLLAVALYMHPALLIAGYDTTTVEAVDGDTDESLATAEVRVADGFLKRYVGLSATEELGPNEGMLFVHDEPGEYGYVMRDMAFAIDIVFVDADGTVTTTHEAEPESRPLTTYEGQGKYVLEVPKGWSADNDVEPGDRIVFELP